LRLFIALLLITGSLILIIIIIKIIVHIWIHLILILLLKIILHLIELFHIINLTTLTRITILRVRTKSIHTWCIISQRQLIPVQKFIKIIKNFTLCGFNNCEKLFKLFFNILVFHKFLEKFFTKIFKNNIGEFFNKS